VMLRRLAAAVNASATKGLSGTTSSFGTSRKRRPRRLACW
jgi:hypothetical protein